MEIKEKLMPKYDLVILRDVIEHILKDKKINFLNSVKNYMDDDSRLLVTFPPYFSAFGLHQQAFLKMPFKVFPFLGWLPKIVIYTVKVLIGKNKKIFNGIAYLGYRPTFGGKEIVLEVNIFGFKKNLYKKVLRVYFLKFIRGEQKFNSSGSLMKQMNKDVILAKKSLKTKLIL